MFQSSPAPKDRCNARPLIIKTGRGYVSILTGPEGPVQLLAGQSAGQLAKEFQSSPAPKDRCNMSFVPCVSRHTSVSILTGPEGPVQRVAEVDIPALPNVSNLTGPGGPVQLLLGPARQLTCVENVFLDKKNTFNKAGFKELAK